MLILRTPVRTRIIQMNDATAGLFLARLQTLPTHKNAAADLATYRHAAIRFDHTVALLDIPRSLVKERGSQHCSNVSGR